MHRFEHLVAHLLVLVVEFADVSPIVLNHQVSETVTVMPTFIFSPFAIRSGVVCNPVQYHFEAHLMSHFKEVLEVCACAELRVDLTVVDDGVVTAECSLTGDLTDRLTGHHPDDVDTVFLQFGQQCFRGFERAFRCCLTGV